MGIYNHGRAALLPSIMWESFPLITLGVERKLQESLKYLLWSFIFLREGSLEFLIFQSLFEVQLVPITLLLTALGVLFISDLPTT